jgi:arylsulfatase A-like enzyme/tetratricopeptide (TPR) repeat protein
VILRRAIAVFLAALAAGGCARKGADQHAASAPVVLISIDTLRSDHLPAYGYSAVETPHLDRFRRDAILFARAYSHVPLTLPAHLSILTGLLPFEHGVRDNLGYRFDAKAHPTLQSLLKAKGYATGAAVSAYVLRAGTGIGDGFDFYDDKITAPAGSDALGRVQRSGSDTERIASGWLDGVKDRPFFLFFHVYEPHAPYEPPEPFKSRFALPYDGEIAAADAVVGGLLDELRRTGLYDRAIVIVLSDHGEGLGEHGEDEHGVLLYRWALQVPLLVKLPGSARAGTTVAAPVETIDIVPTLGALLLLDLPQGLRGRSLLDVASAPRRIYAETCYPRTHLGWSELRSLVDDRWQYIEGAKRELYDLETDPGERTDRLADHGDLGRSRQTELAGLPAALTAPAATSSEEREQLAALGYLGGSVAATGPLPDPRERIGVLRDVRTAFRLAAAGRDEDAVRAFRAVLDANPLLFDARYELAQTLTRLGRWDEAHDAYKEAMRASPALAPVLALEMGQVCLKRGRLDEAKANARLAEAANAPRAHELLARIALAGDDLDGAEREARRATGDPAAELGAAVVRAEVSIRRERFDEALRIVDEALAQAQARHLALVPDLRFLRGDALARRARYDEAASEFEQEIRLFPRNTQAYTHLAIVRGLQHRSLKEVDEVLARMAAANPGPEALELAAKTLESMGDARGAEMWRRRARRAGKAADKAADTK